MRGDRQRPNGIPSPIVVQNHPAFYEPQTPLQFPLRPYTIGRLLIDATNLGGFGLGTFELFTAGEQLARHAMAAVKIAFVMRPEQIDPRGVGIMVARNRGLFSKAFSSEAEAWKWLLDPNAE